VTDDALLMVIFVCVAVSGLALCKTAIDQGFRKGEWSTGPVHSGGIVARRIGWFFLLVGVLQVLGAIAGVVYTLMWT